MSPSTTSTSREPARDRVPGDGPNRKALTDQLVDHGPTDRSQTGDHMQVLLRLGRLSLHHERSAQIREVFLL